MSCENSWHLPTPAISPKRISDPLRQWQDQAPKPLAPGMLLDGLSQPLEVPIPYIFGLFFRPM